MQRLQLCAEKNVAHMWQQAVQAVQCLCIAQWWGLAGQVSVRWCCFALSGSHASQVAAQCQKRPYVNQRCKNSAGVALGQALAHPQVWAEFSDKLGKVRDADLAGYRVA